METVTISLDHYNEMQAELNQLRKDVQEKTIYKYYHHPIYGFVLLFIIFALLIFNRF